MYMPTTYSANEPGVLRMPSGWSDCGKLLVLGGGKLLVFVLRFYLFNHTYFVALHPLLPQKLAGTNAYRGMCRMMYGNLKVVFR